ncbi:MAG TPA: tetratricopeptide repeat protein [Candidatus Microsaccharimonas sp.]|jgi:tetratricopeptide (TPR) repeat protein
MQLLQQEETDIDSAVDEKNTLPSTSYFGFSENYEVIRDYSETLKLIVEPEAKKNASEQNSTRAIIDLADIHLSRRSYSTAKKYYLRALRLTENSTHVLRKIIRFNNEVNDKESAYKFYKLLMSKSDNYQDIIDYLGFLLDTPKLANSKLVTFKNYRDQNLSQLDIRNLYAAALLRDYKVDLASKELTEILELSDSYIHAVNNLGVIYIYKNEYELAAKYFKRAIAIDSKFTHAYQNLASLYLFMHNQKDALKILSTARNADLLLEDRWVGNLAQLLTDVDNNNELALKLHKGLLQKEPGNPLYLNNLGVNYDRMQKSDEAFNYYQMAVNNLSEIDIPHPVTDQHGVILNNLLNSMIRQGKKKDASKLSRRILTIFPDNVPALAYRVRELMDEHNLEEARSLSEKAYELDRSQPDIVLNLSYIYAVADLNNQRALEILKSFLSSFKEDTEKMWFHDLLYNNLAYNLIKVGELGEGELYISKAKANPIVMSTKALLALYKDEAELALKIYASSINDIEDPFNRDMNILFSKYEFSKYYYEKKNYKQALEHVDEGLQYDLNQKVRSRLRVLRKSILEKL